MTRLRALTPQVLRDEPAYRLLFGSQVLSVLGDRVASVALPFAVLAVGGGVGQVALVSAAQFVPFVVLALPAGVWADRGDRKRFLIASDLVRFTTQTIAATLLLTGAAQVSHLVVLAACFGAADAFFAPAFAGLLPTTVSPANLQSANALRGLTFSSANVAGPVLAGVLIAVAGGPGAALALDAATFLVSVALLTPLRSTDVADAAPVSAEPGFWSSLRQGWTEVRSRPWVGALLGGLSVYHAVVLPAIYVVGPVLMLRDYDGAGSWALVVALFGVGTIAGDLLLMVWRPARALRAAGFLLIGASCQAAVIGSGLPILAIGLLELLAGVCVTAMFTLWETSLGEHVPSRALSRVSSYDYLATTGVMPLGNLLIGGATVALGTTTTLTGMTVLGVSASCLVCAVPAVRHLQRPGPPGSASGRSS